MESWKIWKWRGVLAPVKVKLIGEIHEGKGARKKKIRREKMKRVILERLVGIRKRK